MKAENIEQIRKIHGRILSATESIEDTVGTNLISVWRRDQIIAACEQIDECVRQLEGIMIEEEPIVVALNDFQAAFEGDQDAQARLDAAFDMFDTIDWTKPIQTRDGRKAEFVRRILQPPHDFGDDYLCIVDVGNGYEEPVQYFKNGRIGLDEESNHDIINIPEDK